VKNKVVLDASALLALIQQERGAETVKPLLKSAVMSAVNIAECLSALQRADVLAEEALSLITDIISIIIPFDVEQAACVADLQSKVKHKGLSLGDRACVALGMKLQIPIYTSDRIWAELALDNVEIRLIR
jgi:PIN domain nuclease of toxin-antitoxin system